MGLFGSLFGGGLLGSLFGGSPSATITGAIIGGWPSTSSGSSPQQSTGSGSPNVPVGDYVCPQAYIPYLREQVILFYAKGLRPGAKVHVFFDQQFVTNRVIPGVITDLTSITPTKAGAEFIDLDSTTIATRLTLNTDASVLTVAENGTVAGAFYVPASTFFVGDRDLVIADVSLYNSISAASTTSKATFRAYNFDPRQVQAIRPSGTSVGTPDGSTTNQTINGLPTVYTNPASGNIVSGAFITLYNNTNFNGNSTTFFGTLGSLKGFNANGIFDWNDKAKSARVSGTWTLFQHEFFGKKITISANTPDITSIDGLTSFQLVAPPPANNPQVTPITDPIAETFAITPDMVESREGVFLTELDLFFQKKDNVRGITVEVRQTVNGFPAKTLIPGGTKWLPSASVNISETGNTATTFVFDAPVYLPTGAEYCFVVLPDGNSPDYQIFVAQTGQSDLATGTVVRQDWGNGVMFQSTNNSAWTPVQNEDIKFVMRHAQFASTSGSISLTNKNYEFFTLTSHDSLFMHGEKVFKVVANLTGNITSNTSNLNLVGNGTTFQTQISPGEFITIPNSNTSPNAYHLVQVNSIVSNTLLTLRSLPRYEVISGKAMKPPYGTVSHFNAVTNEITLVDSIAANATFLFANGDTIIGDLSSGNGVINVVTNRIVSYFQPLIGKLVINGTALQLLTRISNTSYGLQSFADTKFNDTNYFHNFEGMIASRSNEIVNASGQKSFTANVVFGTNSTRTSPILDLQNMSILTYKNIISSNNSGETTNNGFANTKHISATVVLGANQEAEDMRVFITAYQPSGTDIEIYSKILNPSDPETLTTKTWTKLERITPSAVISDSGDVNDYIELEYKLPSEPVLFGPATGVASVANNTNTITGTGTQWELGTGNNALTTADAIRISDPNNSEVYDIQRVTAVTNNTSITVGSNVNFNSAGAIIEKLQFPNQAFLFAPNDNIVRYFGVNGGVYDGYKTFVLKVVLLANTTNNPPRVSDIRAIALSV